MTVDVDRVKKLLAEASVPPWRESGSEAIVAPNAPSENDRFYEGMHLVCESVFHAGDRALITQTPTIIAELVRRIESAEALLHRYAREDTLPAIDEDAESHFASFGDNP